jgi:hypothetical protein
MRSRRTSERLKTSPPINPRINPPLPAKKATPPLAPMLGRLLSGLIVMREAEAAIRRLDFPDQRLGTKPSQG